MDWRTAYLNILYNRGNIYENLRQYLKGNDGSGVLNIINLCSDKDSFREIINYTAFYSKSFDSQLCGLLGISKLSCEKIALLFSALSNIEKNNINKFIKMKRDYEYNILTGDYSRAYTILKGAFERFGLSIWLIDNVSLLYSLDEKVFVMEDELSELLKHNLYSMFRLKNNRKTMHNHYLKQMRDVFDNEKKYYEAFDYYKYILFLSHPKNEKEWKNVFIMSSLFSFIDVYLCLVDYLQNVISDDRQQLTNKSIFVKCFEGINESKLFNTICQYNDVVDSATMSLIESFKGSNYQDVVACFNNGFVDYTSIGVYILVSLSHLFLGVTPEIDEDILRNTIINLMIMVLKKEEENIVSAVLRLATITRLLKSFDIHKGLSVFLNLVAKYIYVYNISEMYSTCVDMCFRDILISSMNSSLVPFAKNHMILSDDVTEEYIELYKCKSIGVCNNNSKNYFLEGYNFLVFNKYIESQQFDKATELFVHTYIDNRFLVLDLDSKKISEYVRNKHRNYEPLSIDELCYVYIDLDMEDLMDDAFLDLFDYYYGKTPIEIVNDCNSCSGVNNYFLYEICNTSNLSKIYLLFSSGEEAEDYRMEICDYLLTQNEVKEVKALREEIENITKRRTLASKIKKINESKLIINEELLKKECRDKIIEMLELFNNTSAIEFIFKNKNSGVSFCKLNHDRKKYVTEMYNIFCKEFCFGNYGLDISLSTRVRHGALKNKILKVFSDNQLVFNGHGSNDYFDRNFQINAIDRKATTVFGVFYDNVTDILDYFVKHTLKVFIDTPIEGAVFDYKNDVSGCDRIFSEIQLSSEVSCEEVVLLIKHRVIEKTNEYLQIIRNQELKILEKNLLTELDNLSEAIKIHYLDSNIQRELERRIVTCKTDVQNELENIAGWFILSDYNEWEAFTFEDLIRTCIEIDKNLFSSFDKININIDTQTNKSIKGFCFREFVDILLIIFNNALTHSGYMNNPEELTIDCVFSEDSNSFYLSFANNLNDSVDLIRLDKIVKHVNSVYRSKEFLKYNVRQEGGMGLYKIMHILSSIIQQENSFYINRNENHFRIELKLSKEIFE